MHFEHQLKNANCPEPFEFLGLSHAEKGLRLRVWLPNVVSVTVKNMKTGESLGDMQRCDNTDLFVAQYPEQKHFFPYELLVQTDSGEYRRFDPYQFQEQAYQAVHFVDHAPENVYRQLGAQVIALDVGLDEPVSGVRFAVYAPNASSVALVGDFNWWNDACMPMQRTSMGYWVLFVPGVKAGDKYKYRLRDRAGNELPHKADPVGFQAEQYPSHASVVYDHNGYEWQDDDWLTQAEQDKYSTPMSVYEVHLGSWRRKADTNDYLSYRELAKDLLKYVKDMGYTHIEILPVSEYPFDGSWGYQPVGMFAPTSRFGSPDDFKHFVDQFHQAGIGVIIDWVPAHFPEDGHGLARFDGTCVYEYEDPRKGWHPDWNSLIYDFGKDTVRQFLVASALYWVDKFHIDGLRVDAVASMLYLDYSRNDGEWIPNVDGGNKNYEAISLLQWMNREVYQKFPRVMTIAEESTSFPKVSRPLYDGGLGFGFKWNMGWMNDTLHYIAKDPAYRRYHHNEITFSMVYAFDENFILPISHDEVVHGKGSLLRKMPGDEQQQAANMRCYSGFMYAHPGKKLNFMGNEFGQSSEWNYDTGLQWELLKEKKHAGLQSLFKDLNKLYVSMPALHELDHSNEGFEWVDHHNHEQSVLALVRKSKDGKQKLYMVTNFTPVPRDDFVIGVLDEGDYQLVLNTEAKKYGGNTVIRKRKYKTEAEPWHEKPHRVTFDLPPLATVYLAYNEKK